MFNDINENQTNTYYSSLSSEMVKPNKQDLDVKRTPPIITTVSTAPIFKL